MPLEQNPHPFVPGSGAQQRSGVGQGCVVSHAGGTEQGSASSPESVGLESTGVDVSELVSVGVDVSVDEPVSVGVDVSVGVEVSVDDVSVEVVSPACESVVVAVSPLAVSAPPSGEPPPLVSSLELHAASPTALTVKKRKASRFMGSPRLRA